MRSSLKINIKKYLAIILVFFFAFSFLFCSSAVSEESGFSKKANIGRDESPASPTETKLAKDESPVSPTISGGSSGIPYAKYNLTISVEPKAPLRNASVLLNLTIRNNDVSLLTVQFITLQISPGFEPISCHQVNSSEIIPLDVDGRNARMGPFKLEKLETKQFNYEIRIPRSVEANKTNLLSSYPELKFKGYRSLKSNEKIDSEIDIQNNPPEIHWSEALFPEHMVKEWGNNGTLLFIGNTSIPIEVKFKIKATDVEDGDSIKFIGFAVGQDGTELGNRTSLEHFSNTSQFERRIESIKAGEKYSLWSLVQDKNNKTHKYLTTIRYLGKGYYNIYIPNISFCEKAALGLTLLFTIIITFFVVNWFKYSSRAFTKNTLITLFILIWVTYLLLLQFEPHVLPFGDYVIFYNSLPLFELVIYLSVLLPLYYFVEQCFSIDKNDKSVYSLLIISGFMIVILVIFMLLIPQISNVTYYLSGYYSTMSTVFGTIFGLMVTLSGQFPKNILIFNDRDSNSSQSNRGSISYHERIWLFVGLYGAALGISLLGVVAGISIKFNTLIMEFNRESIMNLVSIALFEISFLLIPPAILSLYHLLQVISFRGKVCITSDPSNAKLSISKRYNYNCPDSDLDNTSKPSNLDLTTPCTLYLPSGKYKIGVQYKFEEMPIKCQIITIRDGMEKEYSFNASDTPCTKDTLQNPENRD